MIIKENVTSYRQWNETALGDRASRNSTRKVDFLVYNNRRPVDWIQNTFVCLWVPMSSIELVLFAMILNHSFQ